MYYNAVMEKVKQPSVAGTFYTTDAADLKKQIDTFKENSKNQYTVSARAVIVPHAGLVYSGRLAFEGISMLDKNIENVFIFAPAHRAGFEGLALSSFDGWNTPFGDIEINQGINKELEEKFEAKFYDAALEKEHAIEIQIPLIQQLFENVKIIPVLIGMEKPETIEKIIETYYPDTRNGFIISSDLSHFLKDEQAKKLDSITAQMIEAGNIANFSPRQACGMTGILGLTRFANQKNYSLIRIDMTNSSSVSGDKTSVVGYGCWFLYEGEKNHFLKEHYSDLIKQLCRLSIKSRLEKFNEKINYPQVLDEAGACFVTLETNGQLRGCIGSIIAHKTLIEDLLTNAQHAAFSDPRFKPLTKEEFEKTDIAVSVLSEPKPLAFNGEEDLLEKIVPFKDGIIIKDGNHQAVYLPSVWEQLPDKKEFLNSLKIKAGLAPEHFSKTFQAFRFETVYIK